MYIANSTLTTRGDSIIAYLPHSLRKYLYGTDLSEAYEIQLCSCHPLTIYYPGERLFVASDGTLTDNPYAAVRVSTAHITEAMEIASKSSIYSVEDEIRNGYITIEGGHRIGICGSAVIKDGHITFVRDISALNYRLAREVKGAADSVIEMIYNGGQIRNTLIISPPGAGKTTMLRDIVRQLSNEGVRVCVVDERREIASMHSGRTDFDLGTSTTVFSGAPKAAGMLMMLRAMSPEVIVTDEIGTASDARALTKIINSGTKVITSIHGFDAEQVRRRRDLKTAIPYFEAFITLSRHERIGTVEETVIL